MIVLPRVVVVTVAATLDQWRMGAGPNEERGMTMCHDSYQDVAGDLLVLDGMTIEDERGDDGTDERGPPRSLV
jgi:hypothetical protein